MCYGMACKYERTVATAVAEWARVLMHASSHDCVPPAPGNLTVPNDKTVEESALPKGQKVTRNSQSKNKARTG